MSPQPTVIDARGTPREVGRQIGEAGRDLVARGLAAYEQRFPVLAGFSFAEAVERSRAYLRPAEGYVPQAVDQIRGLAEGANVPFERLFALNCSEEFTCGADLVWPRPEHCTSIAVVAGGRVVSGHNEDWYPDDVDNLVVRKVSLAGAGTWSGAYLSVGPAYDLPITGITSRGFTSAANTVYFRDERVGVPNNCLLAGVLQQPDLEHVRDLIAGSPRARGSNYLLCDAGGRIWDIETTAERWAFIDGGDALHARQPLRLAGARARTTPRGSEGSPKRRARAEELLTAGVEAGADLSSSARSVLSDHANRRSASARTGTTTTRTRTRTSPRRAWCGSRPRAAPTSPRTALLVGVRDLRAVSRAHGRFPPHQRPGLNGRRRPLLDPARRRRPRRCGSTARSTSGWSRCANAAAPLDLYHAALVVTCPRAASRSRARRARGRRGHARGVVAGGAVGSRWAGAFRIFRYEVRCWRDGVIPDLA